MWLLAGIGLAYSGHGSQWLLVPLRPVAATGLACSGHGQLIDR